MLTSDQSFFERYALHLGVGAFVLMSSFLYGVTIGLQKNAAMALLPRRAAPLFDSTDVRLRRLIPPADAIVTPLGREMTINNHAAEMISIYSDRSATALLEEQAQIWKTQGLKVIASTGKHRGFVLALKGAGEERYFFSAWTVPPQLREKMSAGKLTQGSMSVYDFSPADQASDGGIPEIPIKTGGKGGAVISSLDPGGRTYSSVYTVPGDIRENIEYYRAELETQGWQVLHQNSSLPDQAEPDRADYEVGNLVFNKSGEEIVMLFTPVTNDSSEDMSGPQTVVSITKGTLNIERWRDLG